MSDKFDIEHFPTSPTAVRMMSRISPIYDKSYVGKWIFQVMGADMDAVRQRFEELKDQAFPETATWGLKYWAQRYGIESDRRQDIISKRNTHFAMNPARMEDIIKNITGLDVVVNEDIRPYTFSVFIINNSDPNLDLQDITKRIKEIKPSHQAFNLIVPSAQKSIKLYFGGTVYSHSTTRVPEWNE